MGWPAVVGGVVAGVGGVLGGLMGNDFARSESERNRAFQAHQSATAHQREIADLKAAGLNPILSGTGGMGATTSAGSMAAQSDVVTPAINTGLTAYSTYLDGQNKRETNLQIQQQTAKLKAETMLTEEQTKVTSATIPKAESQAEIWLQILRGLKGINKSIIDPIIKRLQSPGTGKAVSDAIQDAKNLVESAKQSAKDIREYPKKQYQRAKHKLTNPPQGIELDEDSNFSPN